MTKPAHIQRMEDEQTELSGKILKLDEFTDGTEFFVKLPAVDQDLLRVQSSAMKTYSSVLALRLLRAAG